MPIITVDVESTQQTVTRHVAMGVVYDVAASLGIPYNIRVVYPGSEDPEDLPITVADDGRNKQYDPAMKVLVEVQERFVDRDLATMVLQPNSNKPIFYDPDLGVSITPIYAQTEMTINFRFRFVDRNLAEKTMNDMRRHATLFRDGLMHELRYKYLIPKVELVILKNIHELRESQAGYGEDLSQWFQDHFSDQVTVLSNLSGKSLSMAKEEVQTGVMGQYDFEIVPENPELGQSKATSIMTFAYVFRYDKPISATMKYPILIHNQPLPGDLYDRRVPFVLEERLNLPSRVRALTDTYTNNRYVTGFQMGAPIPIFNDWQPPTVVNGVEGLLRIMLAVDANDPYSLLNLNELGEVALVDPLIDYIHKEKERVFLHTNSAIHIALYENDRMLGANHLTIDDDLNIRTTFEMKLRNHYNLLIAIQTDLRLLKPSAVERLRKDGDLMSRLLRGIHPTLKESELPKTMSGGYVSKAEWDRVLDIMTRKRQPIYGEDRYGHFRVGSFVVVV